MYRNQKDFDRWGRFYFDGDSGGSGGWTPEIQEKFDRRLAKLEGKDNAPLTLAQELYRENYTLRETNREMKDKLIPDGGIVITGDDIKAWEAYKALGKPDEIKAGLDQRNQFQGELEKAQRAETLRKVADAAGYKYDVLADVEELARARGKTLAFEVRPMQQQDGSQKPVAFVKDGTTEKPLTEYAQVEWANHLAALQAQGGQQQQQQTGARFIPQHSTSNGGGGADLVQAHIDAQQKRAAAAPNPLAQS